ncbi:MAG: sulfite exporter TauE/SafE family protein [Colwellia sp.]|nr:sulfite exporter TauE/SafE family protein [Colwellia sp.]MCW8866116.1 sulfite exporter TauE/SafE family protein [Colwellia sp.]MCW9082608.1 sulfite exporter TauE/SafE family protein [Colwellia sp.]
MVLNTLDIYQAIILIAIGLMAGVINTLAGGGSNLSLPALMMYGLPADVANATNRVSVLMQSITASRGFYNHDKIDARSVKDTFFPLLFGGLVGAIAASYINVELLKPLLLGTMIAVSLWVVLKSDVQTEQHSKQKSCYSSKFALLATFASGFYGGFVQAGVGFVLIATFVGALNYDLLRANAMKVVATVIFTSIALLVFIFRDQIAWIPGILLGIGSIVGAQIAVKFAIEVKAKTLKIMVLLMTIFASAAALI